MRAAGEPPRWAQPRHRPGRPAPAGPAPAARASSAAGSAGSPAASLLSRAGGGWLRRPPGPCAGHAPRRGGPARGRGREGFSPPPARSRREADQPVPGSRRPTRTRAGPPWLVWPARRACGAEVRAGRAARARVRPVWRGAAGPITSGAAAASGTTTGPGAGATASGGLVGVASCSEPCGRRVLECRRRGRRRVRRDRWQCSPPARARPAARASGAASNQHGHGGESSGERRRAAIHGPGSHPLTTWRAATAIYASTA